MQVKRDIPYAPEHGKQGLLDLFLPDKAPNCPIVMIVHGGGLQALSKERMDGVSSVIASQGWVAVNVNYRLLPAHSYPSSLEDVLSAYNWILDTDYEDICRQDRTRVALLGASVGGFLVMAAGFILGKSQVKGIVTISGPSQRRCSSDIAIDKGLDSRLYCSPIELVTPDSPPLLATHSRNDELVKPEESIAIVKCMQETGCQAELYLYDGPGNLHGIWRDDQPPLRLFQHIEEIISSFLKACLKN